MIQSMVLGGRCSSGTEGDRGTRVHAVPVESNRALCGVKPGRRSAGWFPPLSMGTEVTCPQCIKKSELMKSKTDVLKDARKALDMLDRAQYGCELPGSGELAPSGPVSQSFAIGYVREWLRSALELSDQPKCDP